MKESYAIETRHLTKRYGEQVAVNDVCLHVPKGHIYGLLGRNGAGKTSIMKLILQLMPATSGETLLFGEPGEAQRARCLSAYWCHHRNTWFLSQSDGDRKSGNIRQAAGNDPP